MRHGRRVKEMPERGQPRVEGLSIPGESCESSWGRNVTALRGGPPGSCGAAEDWCETGMLGRWAARVSGS